MSSLEHSVACKDGNAEVPNSFVGYLQVFNYEIAATLRITALVVYPVHVVLLHCSSLYHRWIIKYGYTVFCLLPVRLGSDLKDSCSIHEGWPSVYWLTGTDEVHAKETRRFSSQGNEGQNKMSLLQDAIMKILRPLADAESIFFRMNRVGKDVWN